MSFYDSVQTCFCIWTSIKIINPLGNVEINKERIEIEVNGKKIKTFYYDFNSEGEYYISEIMPSRGYKVDENKYTFSFENWEQIITALYGKNGVDYINDYLKRKRFKCLIKRMIHRY